MGWIEKSPKARRQRPAGAEAERLGWANRSMAQCGKRTEPTEEEEQLCVFSHLTRPWSSAPKLGNPEGKAGLSLGLGGGLGTTGLGADLLAGRSQSRLRQAADPHSLSLLRPHESLGSHSSRSTWTATSSLWQAPALAPHTLPLPAPSQPQDILKYTFSFLQLGQGGAQAQNRADQREAAATMGHSG